MSWLLRGVILLLISLLPVPTAAPDTGFVHPLEHATGNLDSPGASDHHAADPSNLEHEAPATVRRQTPPVAPFRPPSRWACESPGIRGLLIGYPRDRVGSCVSLTLHSVVGALDGGKLTEEQVHVLLWALDLFEQADMQLPTFLVSNEPEDACDGNAAVVSSTASVPHIRMCTPHTGAVLEWVMLHELGHIWTERHVDLERRALFLAVRSLAKWRSGVRTESGTEQAADVIVWALMDRPVRPILLLSMSCVELEVAFRALTGERPLHGYNEVCSRS